MSSKTFRGEFDKFVGKLQEKENFAFGRFSDGELFMLQNKEVALAENHYITGELRGIGKYTPEEQKHFKPEDHKFYRDKLEEAFKCRKNNYFKGISGRVDVGEEDFQWQLNLYGEGDEEHLTFANVFINNNYPRFLTEVVPHFTEREIIFVVNEAANLEGLPFAVKQDFRIGSNCMIDSYETVQKVKDYLDTNNIKDHIILCSAASLSNYVIHECYKEHEENTFLDIGSSLNPYMNLPGWQYSRAYLQHWWLGRTNQYGIKEDVW
jgi:hypothetical protein